MSALAGEVSRVQGGVAVTEFPLELNNTDYLRRVLCHANDALTKLYKSAQQRETHQLPRPGPYGRDVLPCLEEDQEAALRVLQRIAAHRGCFEGHVALSRDALEEFEHWLRGSGRLSAEDVLVGVPTDRLKDAFLRAIALVNAAGQQQGVANLRSLQRAWLEHEASKQSRRQQQHQLKEQQQGEHKEEERYGSENQAPLESLTRAGSLSSSKGRGQGGAKRRPVLREKQQNNSNNSAAAVPPSRCALITAEDLRQSTDLTLVLEAMRQQRGSAAIQEQGCRSVADIASGDSSGNYGGISSSKGLDESCALRTIQQAMRLHPGSVAVQTEAFGAVAALCSCSGAAAAEAGELGLLADVQAAMEDHRGCVGLQEQGCEVVGRITSGAVENARIAGEQGLLESIQAAMEDHLPSPAVQQYGCIALRSIASGSAENRARAGEQGLLESVQAAMRVHRSSAPVQQQGVWAIRAVTFDSAANQARAEELGLLEDIRAGMEAHRGSPAVQQGLLGGIGRRHKGSSRLHPSPLEGDYEEEGAEEEEGCPHPRKASSCAHHHNGVLLETIQQTMRANRGCVAVQVGLRTAPCTPSRACASFALLRALTAFPLLPFEQERACATIRIIGNSEDPSAMWGAEELLEDLQEAMRLHPGSAAIQEQALGALGACCANNAANAAHAGALGLLEDAREAMRLHPGSAAVQHEGCEAIATVIGNAHALRREAGRLGLLGTVQAAMRSHRGSALVQEWACTAVWDLTTSGDAENKAQAGALDLLADVQAAMRRHRGHVGVQEEAFWCIRNITAGSKANKARARRLGLGDDVREAARLHPEEPAIQSLAAGALGGL